MKIPSKIINAVDHFKKLPGVGEKSAFRQILHMTGWNRDELQSFANSMELLAELKKCTQCGMFAEESTCEICASESRVEAKSICVVESVTDCLAIEKSGEFKGCYYILGGVLNPLLGIGPEELALNKFFARVKEEKIAEIILAVNPSVEGDATCSYIKQMLSDQVEIDRIGFGIPIGGSLEYLDSMTVAKALENKRKM